MKMFLRFEKTIFVAAVLTAAFLPAIHAQTASITIQAADQGEPISPDLIGVFFEDLNYAADGGLYAELVQNRSFEYSPTEQPGWNPLSFWDFQKRNDGDGSIEVADMRPIHKNNPHYALLKVTKAGDGVGIANSGFDGIPLKAGEHYEASFWAYQAFMGIMWGRGDNTKPMPVNLRIETKNGEVLAQTNFNILGREWTQFRFKFTAPSTVTDARLVLLAKEVGGICFDMISLFPEKTFHNHPNGLRADLAQAIADLKPKFMRFPGGCLVHGQGIYQYYDWKDSIGPVEQRKAGRNLWGYDQTRGLGYYEFFQFCEDIGAKPLPVVSAGVCCQHAGSSPGRGQEGLPMAEMADYIQDVLDLIEWANGPATSKWGAKRAAAGHPEPFGLKYLGIGNEDDITPNFKERFKMIFDAVKAKYPSIIVVGTAGPFPSGADFDKGWEFAKKELKVPMVDEHYYVAPQWFWDNLARYDKYDRSGPKVYVGEYAAHDREKSRNTLRSAIAEAAGLTSFERNGDIVHFASYAPLLSRRNHTQWTPDMIYFTGTEMFLSANYYVQQLFGQNSGDEYLTTAIDAAGQSVKLAASTVHDSKSGDIMLKVVNGADTAATLKIELAGVPTTEFKAVRTVLTGASGDDCNEDGKPPVVRPMATEVNLKTSFNYEAPANSLTVFRFKL